MELSGLDFCENKIVEALRGPGRIDDGGRGMPLGRLEAPELAFLLPVDGFGRFGRGHEVRSGIAETKRKETDGGAQEGSGTIKRSRAAIHDSADFLSVSQRGRVGKRMDTSNRDGFGGFSLGGEG